MSKITNDIYDVLKDSVQTIPGVVNFGSIDENNDINEPIIINEIESQEFDIRIALVINRNISIHNICEQMYKLIKFKLEKINVSKFKLNIYIKGVK